jgi:hypothetical protein
MEKRKNLVKWKTVLCYLEEKAFCAKMAQAEYARNIEKPTDNKPS